LIPPFDERGQLPPGIHPTTLAEVLEHFGVGSESREACAQSLQWLAPICRLAGIERLLINGSFVSSRAEPGDVDCVLVAGEDFMAESDAARAIRIGLPYLSLQVVASAEEFEFFVDLFSTDRSGSAKGLVEIIQ
jgi:hypothetical protein